MQYFESEFRFLVDPVILTVIYYLNGNSGCWIFDLKSNPIEAVVQIFGQNEDQAACAMNLIYISFIIDKNSRYLDFMLCITAVPNNFDSLKNWPEESFCNDDYCFIFDVEKQN